MNQEAVVKNKKSIYIVWIIPVIAMLLAGWMIFKHYDNKGYEITVVFDNGSGMVVGKTPLMFNGMKIGQVSDMQIHHGDISKVDVTITVDKKAKGVAREGNTFWKVEPTVSLTEITGLSTILSGVYIGVMPSVKDPAELFKLPKQELFIAAKEIPIDIFDPGILIVLHAKKSNIKAGAPILYKKVTVGKVLEVLLTEKGVDYLIKVDEKFVYLVKENSRFWEISGLEVRASLAGIRVEMDSLASVIAGGISFTSPFEGKSITEHRQEYTLAENFEQLSLEDDCITLISSNGYNIDVKSAHVFFKGSDAGNVMSQDYNPSTQETTFKIKLKSKYRHLANNDAYFWIVEPRIGLTELKGLGAIASGPYISFETKTKSKKLKKGFTLHEDAPTLSGKHFQLIADGSFNLKSGVNIIHKDIVIGRLQRYKLAKNSQDIHFDIVIADEYKHLVNNSSSFYVQGALEIDASLDGIYLNVGSISSMVNGGIVLETRDLKAPFTNKKFTLFDSYQKYKNEEYVKDGGRFFTLFANSLNSVKENSPVIYKGIKVGKVIRFNLNKDSSKVEILVYIKKEYASEVNPSTSFFNVSGVQVKASLDGVKIQTSSLESIISGGIAFKTPLKEEASKSMEKFKLYKDEDAVDEKYVSISFFTTEDTALKEGSKIVYKSITIGQVKDMKLIGDEVVIDALIKEEHKNMLVSDSVFWVEDVTINIDKIENPSAILSGAFIKILKGKSEITASKFALSKVAPVATMEKEGLRVLVTGTKLSSLKVGSPVFYRQVKIGSIEKVSLSKNSKGVDLKLYIDKCYSYLVRQNSIFYNATAIGMDISLFGVKISTETISTMINGGITMVVPDDFLDKAEENRNFKLYNDPDEDWLEYEPELYNDNLTCEK